MSECETSLMLSPYYDGELDPAQRRQVEAHLRFCPQCARELDQMRALSAALNSMDVPAATPDFVARIQSQAAAVQDLTLVRFVRRLTAVAAAVLALAACRYTFDDGPIAAPPGVAALNPWERTAINPDPSSSSTATASAAISAESQFDDFIVRDLSGGVE